MLKALVDTTGSVREVRLLRGSHPLLDRAAIETAHRWTFTPPRRHIQPDPVWLSIPVTFRLPQPPASPPLCANDEWCGVEIQAIPFSHEPPIYPDSARAAGIEGRVIVSALVNEVGAVFEAHVLRPAHPLLDRAAIEAVRSWTFAPARHHVRPVAVWTSIPVTFRLPEPPPVP